MLGAENKNATGVTVAFYTVICIGVLPQHGEAAPSENLVSVLVSSLCEVSLRSRCDDLMAGALMILSKLCTTVTLHSTFLTSLTRIVAKVIWLSFLNSFERLDLNVFGKKSVIFYC